MNFFEFFDFCLTKQDVIVAVQDERTFEDTVLLLQGLYLLDDAVTESFYVFQKFLGFFFWLVGTIVKFLR